MSIQDYRVVGTIARRNGFNGPLQRYEVVWYVGPLDTCRRFVADNSPGGSCGSLRIEPKTRDGQA